MTDIAGIKDKTVTPTKAQLINAIGRDFTDPAFMSITTNPSIATSFSSHSNTMIVIYASSEVLSKLGAVVIDSFSGWGAGEYEILFNLGAKFKVLDVGTIEVSGAASYKLQYRKAGASKWKTVRLSKTSRVLKKMKNGGLYQYRVAAVDKNKKTGKYSEPSYRFYRKTKGIKYKARKGAIKITWKKTKSASGYKILVADNKKMKNARVITIKGGNRYIGIRSKIKKVRVK